MNMHASETGFDTAEAPADLAETIAIIGLAGRFPGADDIDTFWENQVAMRAGSSTLSREQMAESGRTDAQLARRDLVGLDASIRDFDCFDAPFFGINASEAELMDPQMRLLLETAWEALENGGCVPSTFAGRIGVFAAANISTYWLHNLAGRYREADPNELLHIVATNSQDYLATSIAYRLGLTGPALTVQTACSSGLVLSSIACQHLLDGSCDAALVLAASLTFPVGGGYFSTADSIFSPDGVCRPFDANANGTFASDGVCAILVKRAEDAEADGDRVLAHIKGWALNNDGRRKIGFFAPSSEGQRDVLFEAAAAAGIQPGDLDYIETHGTGTTLGDPIEFEAIRAVHGQAVAPGDSLALSSVKSSIGHLGAAAGLGGLVRATLAVHNRTMPGTLNFRTLNPSIRTEGTQLHVLDRTTPFPRRGRLPRAGISSFGIGGTNAHVIIEGSEPTPTAPGSEGTWPEVIGLSAIDTNGIARARSRLRDWLASGRVPATESVPATLPEIADTSLLARQAFTFRSAVHGRTRTEMIEALSQHVDPKTLTAITTPSRVCFVFTGSGVPSSSHSESLARHFPAFRDALAEIDALLAQNGQSPVSDWLYRQKTADDERHLAQSHVAAFAFGYANARLWQAMGVPPSIVLGHSMGEIAAACLAGAIDLADALSFVGTRARIIEEAAEPGELLAVALDAGSLAEPIALFPGMEIAGHNGIGQTLVAGPRPMIDRFAEHLRGLDIAVSMLPAGRPFHSSGMSATAEPIGRAASGLFRAATLPLASTVTGAIETDRLENPSHWSAQMTTPVNFTAAIDAAIGEGATLFLELGPRATFVSTASRTLRARAGDLSWRASFNPRPRASEADILSAIAETRAWLFEHGVVTQSPHRPRAKKTTLPAYPFARLRFWRDEHRTTESNPGPRPVPHAETSDPETPYQNETAEEMLRTLIAGIWSAELGQDHIASNDSFLALGGSSLTALKVAGAIERSIGVRPPLVSLTESQTFEAFVAAVALMLLDEDDDVPQNTETAR